MEGRPVRIGRDPSSTIRLDDARASRNHAILEPSDDGTWVCRDLQSTNHTYLNGAQVVTAVLKEGDVIRIGSTEMLLGPRESVSDREISLVMTQESLELALRSYDLSPEGASLQESLFRLGLLNEAAKDPNVFLEEALEVLGSCIPFASWAWLDWPDGPERPFRVRGRSRRGGMDEDRVVANQSFLERVIASQTGFLGSTVEIECARGDGRWPRVVSNLAIPLGRGEGVGAVLYLDREESLPAFGRDDLERAAALSSHIFLDLRNISLYRRLEGAYEKLRRSQEDLIQTEKLAGIGRLASSFAHDLNNPLSSVLGFLDLSLRGLESADASTVPPKLPRYLEKARAAADYCRALSRNLLAFARQERLEEGTCRAYDVAETVEATMNICHASLHRLNADVRVDIPQGLTLHGDPSTLQQVVMNLVTNAADALREMDADHVGQIEVLGATAEGGVELTVRDNGPGIPAEIREKIFEPLFTTKAQDRGTGLGLFVVRRIVEESAGHLTVESSPSEGTTFSVFLPLRVASFRAEQDERTVIDLDTVD
jgi:signal transduction histidine kinase